jgi:hypothetical protein
MLNDIIVVISGICAIALMVALLLIDSNKENSKSVEAYLARKLFSSSSDPIGVSSRLYTALKSYLLIFTLFVLLGVFLYFTN